MTNKKVSNFKEFSLTKNYIIFASLVVIFIIILYFYFAQKFYSQNASITLEKQSLRIEKSLIDSIEYTAYLMNYLDDQIKNHDHNDLRYIEKLLSSFRLNPEVNEKTPWNMFSWINAHDLLVVNSNLGIVNPPIDASERDYLKAGKVEPHKIHLGETTYGKVSNELIIPAGLAVIDNDGKYLGTIVFGLQIKKLGEKLWKSTNSEGIAFAIFDYDGNLMISSDNFSDNRIFHESILKSISSEAKSGELNNLHSLGINGSFGYYKKIEKYSYIIVTQFETGFIKRDLQTKIFPYSLGVLIILFVLGLILLLLRMMIINPILSLAKSAKAISEGNFIKTIPTSRITEINRLSKSLLMIQDYVKTEQESKHQINLAKQAAEKANISRATILRSITHDIKNYVFGIFGLTRLILDKKEKEEIEKNEDLQTIETISDQSEELMHFVEDLLDTSQVESGKFALGKIELCNLKNLIGRMLLLNHGLAMRHHIILKSDIEENLPLLKCDARRIKQIMSNLITNAIKYSHTGNEVIIRAKHLVEKKQIYIEVADNGIGLNDKEIAMIMTGGGADIDKTELEKEIDSNGIGMNIVLALLKLHHAEIDIDSSKGVGTKVKLYFNLDFENVSDAENLTTISKIRNKSSKIILLVEDNPVNIKVTSTILQNAGYKTHYVENGKEALKILDEKHFDLILMDGEMPVMNGYEATAKIRSGEYFTNFKNYKKIPIVALMSSSDLDTIKRTKDCGMNDHLEKSSSKNKLLSTVEKYLKAQMVVRKKKV